LLDAPAERRLALGAGTITQHFPDVSDLRLSLAEASDVIVNSRTNRGQRAAEYDRLARDHLPVITLTYRKIQTNRAALEALVAQTTARENREGKRWRWGIIWPCLLAVVLGLAGIVGGYALGKVDPLKPPVAVANTPSIAAKPGAQAPTPLQQGIAHH
jgi:hypothetical protein